MKVLITDKIVDEAQEILKKNFEVHFEELDNEGILSKIENYDAIIVRSRTKVTKDIIEKGKNLKVIGRAGIGVDNIAVDFATQKKIPVVFAPRGSTQSVAELTMAYILSLARMIPKADRSMKNGKWEKKKFKGMELSGKTLGLVGSGRIGSEVARLAQAFGMRTIACDPYVPSEILEKQCIHCVDLGECLSQSDFVSIHSLLTDETRGMIGEEKLKMMKKTAFIINCARGGIIQEEALYKALTEGWIAGAALDVYEDEPPKNNKLIELDNVICTPHIGASTGDAQRKAGIITAEQITKVLLGEKPDFVVNPTYSASSP
jgi:D-3-phosphoglycerate dehydrogenase